MFLTLGYKIPNDESYEIHWDLIKIPKNQIPIEPVRITDDTGKKYYSGGLTNDVIKWGFTRESSYDRFFGRGKLISKLSDARILLVGCGALGSLLAENLARGGVKFMVLEDFDDVESGNLCRANYTLHDLNLKKVDALKKRLISISPFLQVNEIPIKLNSADPEELKQLINENIDVVFDCSTDPELTYILDSIDYQGIVFSLGITNKAKALSCVTGKNLSRQSMHFFEYLENDPADFFEGTGCSYPTFEANFNDVSVLLNTAIKKIEHEIMAGNTLRSFTVKTSDSPTFQLCISEYQKYIHDEETLYISDELVDKIRVETSKHYPKEFGGVFVGRKLDDSIIVHDILIPDKFENGKSIFVRHPGTLNDRLRDAYENSKGKIEYIGEWHSHPDQSPNPSPTDAKTMKEIASEELVTIDDPILLIAEIGMNKFETSIFKYTKNKRLNYERKN